jgi:hypothetical protein
MGVLVEEEGVLDEGEEEAAVVDTMIEAANPISAAQREVGPQEDRTAGSAVRSTRRFHLRSAA